MIYLRLALIAGIAMLPAGAKAIAYYGYAYNQGTGAYQCAELTPQFTTYYGPPRQGFVRWVDDFYCTGVRR